MVWRSTQQKRVPPYKGRAGFDPIRFTQGQERNLTHESRLNIAGFKNGTRPTKGTLLVGFWGTDLGAGNAVEAEQQGPKMNQVGMLE